MIRVTVAVIEAYSNGYSRSFTVQEMISGRSIESVWSQCTRAVHEGSAIAVQVLDLPLYWSTAKVTGRASPSSGVSMEWQNKSLNIII